MRRSRRFIVGIVLVACGATSVCQAATLIERNLAARYGLVRAWYAQVGSPRATGTIAHMNLDRGTLLVQSTRGTLASLDAETGRMLWSTQVGPPDHSSSEPDASEEYVVVVSGSVLYVLDRAHGHILWHKQIGGTPGAGPGASATHAFVPMVNGLIEGFDLAKGAKQTPWVYKSAGRVLVPPMTTPETVSWTTEKGYFYVADPSAGGIRYRLETRKAIHSRPAYWAPRVYACSTDGYVYAVNETTGKIDWKFTVGDAIFQSPAAIEGKVFVISEYSGMYCLDAKDGTQLWRAPRISQFVSLSPSRVYACDPLGRLTALDVKTGTRLGSMPLDGISIKLFNSQSDRVFLANDSCVVQCLREMDLKSPAVHVQPAAEKPEVKAKPKSPSKAPAEESAKEPTDESSAAPEADDKPAMEAEKSDAPADDDADNPFK